MHMQPRCICTTNDRSCHRQSCVMGAEPVPGAGMCWGALLCVPLWQPCSQTGHARERLSSTNSCNRDKEERAAHPPLLPWITARYPGSGDTALAAEPRLSEQRKCLNELSYFSVFRKRSGSKTESKAGATQPGWCSGTVWLLCKSWVRKAALRKQWQHPSPSASLHGSCWDVGPHQ